MRSKIFLCVLCGIGMCLTQCATPVIHDAPYALQDAHVGMAIRAGCVAATNTIDVARASFRAEWETPTSGRGSASGMALWAPGDALRVRLRRYGMTVGELLYDGNTWFLADDMAGVVYITPYIHLVRMQDIPPSFFTTLADVPARGWLPPLYADVAYAEEEGVYRFTWQNNGTAYAVYFHPETPLPLAADIDDIAGGTLRMTFSDIRTNLTRDARTFAPRYDRYEERFLLYEY